MDEFITNGYADKVYNDLKLVDFVEMRVEASGWFEKYMLSGEFTFHAPFDQKLMPNDKFNYSVNFGKGLLSGSAVVTSVFLIWEDDTYLWGIKARSTGAITFTDVRSIDTMTLNECRASDDKSEAEREVVEEFDRMMAEARAVRA